MSSDVYISPNTEIRRPNLFTYGNHIAIDSGFYCTTALELGDYVHIGPHVTCIGGPTTKFVAKGFNNIMAGARIVCGSDRFDGSGIPGVFIKEEKYRDKWILEPVMVEEFANIGTNAIILPGSTLRRGALLCAGSLLMGDTERWGVYKGNPAILIKKINPEKILKNAQEMGYGKYLLQD